MAVEFYDSPIGTLKITSDGKALTGIDISKGGTDDADRITDETIRQLKEYFNGERTAFDLPLAPEGTEFQRKVWDVLLGIPYGETLTYGQTAALAGNASASRAVGNAVGRNPVLIVIPCHRVKAANGIGGFSAGIDIKKHLMRIEKIL